MPICKHMVGYCLASLYCPKQFAFRQGISDPPVEICPRCGMELRRILSSFSAGVNLTAHMAGLSDLLSGFRRPEKVEVMRWAWA
jgi:hypothetical protein